jgi:predicted O-linked N-acetylglucosamine transferase (SPINDLY family)
MQENKKNSEVAYNHGVNFADKKQIDMAETQYLLSIKLNPNNHLSLNNLGALYKDKGELEKAIDCYVKALKADPAFSICKKNISIAYNDYGSQLHAQNKCEEAIKTYLLSIANHNKLPDPHYNLGVVYTQIGKKDEAIISYKQAIQLNPNYVIAMNNLGALYKERMEFDEATKYYSMALKVEPTYPPANNNIAVIYGMQGRVGLAKAALEIAIETDPDYSSAYNIMGSIMRDQGMSKEGLDYFRNAHRLDPTSAAAMANMLLVMNDIPDMDNDEIYEAHREWGIDYSQKYTKLPLLKNMNMKPNKVLKIGYISSDFNTHSVSYFASVLLSHSDPNESRVFCYYNNPNIDQTTLRLKSLLKPGSEWRQIDGLSTEQSCKLIREDYIDILVDLAGHTGGGRLDIFSQKPAPIQVTWIGYPNTTGLPEIDYRITDINADPLEINQQFTEKLIRLPGCFLCYTPAPTHPKSINVTPCLSNGYITFGSFNNFAKINNNVLKLWSNVVLAVPNSKLLLKCKPFACETVLTRVYEQFESFGVTRDRLILLAHLQGTSDHLSLYSKLDIALDTFPYAGTTTTVESLFMGVPVITLKGYNHAHNVGVSLLRSVPAVTHLIAENEEQFVNIAVELANDKENLALLRSGLRDKFLSSRLCNKDEYMKGVHEMYRNMWNDFIQKPK